MAAQALILSNAGDDLTVAIIWPTFKRRDMCLPYPKQKFIRNPSSLSTNKRLSINTHQKN